MTRKKTGCKSCKFAPYTTSGSTTGFGTPIDLTNLENLSYTKNYKEGSNYGDNIQNIYRKKLVSIDLDLDFTEIPLSVKAQICGKAYNQGGMASTTTDKPIQGALMFMETYDDDSYDAVVFYNVTLYEKDGEAQTDTDSFNFTAQGFTGKALPFTNDDVTEIIEYRMDSADSTVSSTALSAFFTTVQFPIASSESAG